MCDRTDTDLRFVLTSRRCNKVGCMFCICSAVNSIGWRIHQHSSAITFAQKREPAPIPQIVVVAGQHDDDVGSLWVIHDKITARATHSE